MITCSEVVRMAYTFHVTETGAKTSGAIPVVLVTKVAQAGKAGVVAWGLKVLAQTLKKACRIQVVGM